MFKQAIKINPNSGAAHINIAVAYYMLGDYPSARIHSIKAKELGVPQAQKILEQLASGGHAAHASCGARKTVFSPFWFSPYRT